MPWGSMAQANNLDGLGDGGSSVADNCWRFEIENRGFLVEETGSWTWADDFSDIDILVYYEGGRPAQIKIIQHKMGSQARRADMLINGQLVVHNIDAPQNIGRIIDLRPVGAPLRFNRPRRPRRCRRHPGGYLHCRDDLHLCPLRLWDEPGLVLRAGRRCLAHG